jgi:hypothetical protein
LLHVQRICSKISPLGRSLRQPSNPPNLTHRHLSVEPNSAQYLQTPRIIQYQKGDFRILRDRKRNVLSLNFPAMTDGEKASAGASVPLGQIGIRDDLGKTGVFVVSEDSAYVIGIELFVDGGVAQI